MDNAQILITQAIANATEITYGTFEVEELCEAMKITQSYDELIEALNLTTLEPYKKIKQSETRRELLLKHAREVHKKQSKAVSTLLGPLLGACDVFAPELFGHVCSESKQVPDGAIKIWRYDFAPAKYKEIIEHPENAEWVAFVPTDVYDREDGYFGFLEEDGYFGFLESGTPFGIFSVEKYSLVENGGDGVLLVGSHK